MGPRRNCGLFHVVLVASCFVGQITGESVSESLFNLGPKLFDYRTAVASEYIPRNVIVSPLGLGIGLGLLESAASVNLQTVIRRKFFNYTGPHSDFQKAVTELPQQLKRSYKIVSRSASAASNGKSSTGHFDDAKLNLYSAIFKNYEVRLEDAFTTHAERAYLAEIVQLNSRCVVVLLMW